MKRRRWLVLLVLVGAVAAFACWKGLDGPMSDRGKPASSSAADVNPETKLSPAKTSSVPQQTASDSAAAEADAARRRLLGVWEDDYQSQRTMTLNEDGTGTMWVKLSGAQAFLFAAELRFDMTWSLDGKTLTKKTVGGEPAVKVSLILKTMGDRADDTILESTDDRLLLLDKDGKTKYDWRRPANADPTGPDRESDAVAGRHGRGSWLAHASANRVARG